MAARKGIGGHTLPNKGATDDWITPKHIITALGRFQLDPCQSDTQPWLCADRGYTKAQDGLNQDWQAESVFMNPPYSQAALWLSKLADHNMGIALIFARTETEMFRKFVWERASAILFLHGRLTFHRPDGTRAPGNSGGPSVLVSYGLEAEYKLLHSKLPGTFMTGWTNV